MLLVCSNRAATQANIPKTREKQHRKNTLICRYFANSRNLQQSIALTSHGRGRWFEPSIAHSRKVVFCSINAEMRYIGEIRIGAFYTSSTPTCFSGGQPWAVQGLREVLKPRVVAHP